MPLMIIPSATYYGGPAPSGEQSFTNAEVLNKLGTDTKGNLTFNGKLVANNSLEVSYSSALSDEHVSQKFIALPNDCDTSQALTLSVNGIAFPRGDAWEVDEHDYPEPDLITWKGLSLDGFVRTGDKMLISYYKKN